MSSHSPSESWESASPKTASVQSSNNDDTQRHVGKCKWFNVAKGYGFIIPDDVEEDVFVHQSELQMDGFRSLADDERVSFLMRQRSTGKGWEAYSVGPEHEGESLIGSSIRPLGKKKDKLIRCFKCGQYGNHLAQRCKKVASDAKVCYHCGSEEHLCGVCPHRPVNKKKLDEVSESPSSAETS